ncbi:MAG: hypothetical protein R3E83_05215 [Burkholderiaceae bacterium]
MPWFPPEAASTRIAAGLKMIEHGIECALRLEAAADLQHLELALHASARRVDLEHRRVPDIGRDASGRGGDRGPIDKGR